MEQDKKELEDFYRNLPDEITIGLKIDKHVFIRMYELERGEISKALMDSERKAVWGWLLETIRNLQRGVRMFYENDAKSGPPSIRFLDDDGNDLNTQVINKKPYS